MNRADQRVAAWPILWIVLLIWLVTRIRYAIDDQYVRVRLMGFTLRKVALSDIESVDTWIPLWNEHWCNTFWPWGRNVRIRRKSGITRNFVISPANRDEFIEALRERLASPTGLPSSLGG